MRTLNKNLVNVIAPQHPNSLTRVAYRQAILNANRSICSAKASNCSDRPADSPLGDKCLAIVPLSPAERSGDRQQWQQLESGDVLGCSFAEVDCAEPRHALCTTMQVARSLRPLALDSDGA